MKKFIFGIMGVVAMLATSCEKSYDDVMVAGNEEAMVTIGVTLPEAATRTFSDGTTATYLQYAVYKQLADGTYERISATFGADDYSGKISDFHLQTSLSLQLLTGNSYRIVFWADNFGKTSNGAYTVSFGTSTVTATTQNSFSSLLKDERADAFYACEDFTLTGNLNRDVELKRATAQINIGTNDYEIAERLGFAGITSASISIQSYMTMNLMTGSTSSRWNVAKAYNSEAYKSKDTETFPVPGYKYMAMAYVFVGDEQETMDITFKYNKESIVIGSVPVQRNHRTNIYGSLLTSKAVFNVEITPDFDDPDLDANDSFLASVALGSATLQEDLTISKQTSITNSTTIDLNGNTLTSDIAISQTQNQEVPFLLNGSGANLTIKGDAEGSTMTTADGATSHLVGLINGATLTIESGTFTTSTKGPLFYIGEPGGGTVYIKGGTFDSGYGAGEQNFLLNCEDAAYNAGTAKFVVTGGKFHNFDPAHSHAEPGLDTNWVPAGYKSVKTTINGDENWYVVVPEGTTVANASNAKSAITAGGSVYLAEDCNYSTTSYATLVNTTNPLDLDLGGNKFSSAGGGTYKDAVVVGNGADVSISNGTINPATNALADGTSATIVLMTSGGGKLTLTDVTVVGNSYPVELRSANADSEIVINSGTYAFTEKWADEQYRDKPVAVYASGDGKITINGGTFGMKGVYSEFLLNVMDSQRKDDVRDNIEVRGGKFYNFDPSNNRAEGEGTNFVADGYTVVSHADGDDTIYEVVAQ